VYATLDRLARDGLVDVTERDGQRTYDITDEGLDELGAWWDTVPADQPPPRDELILKVLLSLTQGADHALEVITRQRGALLGLLQARQSGAGLNRRKSQTLAETLVRDALVVRAEADLRWLDLCEERLAAASSKEPETPDQPARRRGAKR
jgi:DNA-binding PadR family transcriptional regulator